MKQIQVTNLFKKTYDSDKSIIVHRGGARSSKSYSILQYLLYRMTNEAGIKILICRKTMPALKLTAYKTFIDLLKEYGYYDYCSHSLTNNYVTYIPNNAFVAFLSIDNPERIKSSEWNIIHMEEANEFTYNDYMVLRTRLSAPTKKQNKLILSFNPTDAFSYLKTKIVDVNIDIEEIVSNYKDNPFLSKEYVKLLEATKDQDPNFWKIFGLGEWGSLENNIYSNWTEVSTYPTPEETIFGCDFGFNAPTVIIEHGLKPDGIYIKERLYQSSLTNEQLIEFIHNNLPPNSTIYCDCAEPARIAEMRGKNIDARPADKSVKDGIDFVKRQKLFITSDSVNVIKEIRAYTYKTKDDQVLDEPLKFNDHAMDSIRYALYTHLGKRREYSVVF